MIDRFKRLGILLSYSKYAAYPQLPYVQDVLHVQGLSDQQDENGYYRSDVAANWPVYVANVLLVAAIAADQTLFMERYDEAEARRFIAEAIIALCPAEAKCLFVDAFAKARAVLDGPVVAGVMDRNETRAACGCAKCRRIVRQEAEQLSDLS